MKKNILRKDFFMEIKKSMGRFVSIFFIVALGVAFYSGIRASEPSMRLSGDAYLDRNHLMDVKVMGTMGLTEEDRKAIEVREEIEIAEGAYSKDVLCPVGDTSKVVHVLSTQEQFHDVDVVEGRLPNREGECLLDQDFAQMSGYQVGDEIIFKSGNEEKLSDYLKTDTYTVVGIGNSPLYISFGRGISSIGDGTVSGYILVAPSSFDMEVFTEIYARVKGAEELTAFTAAFDESQKQAVDSIDAIKEEQCRKRKEEIQKEAYAKLEEPQEKIAEESQKLEDAKADLEEAKTTAADELSAAYQKLIDAQNKLEASKKQIADGRQQIEAGKNELVRQQNTIDSGWNQISAAETVLAAKEQELADGDAAYQAAIAQIEAGKTQLKEMRDGIELAQGKTVEQLIGELEASASTLQQVVDALAVAKTEEEKEAILSIAGFPSEELLMAQLNHVKTQQAELNGLLAKEQELITQEAALHQKGAEIEAGKAELQKAKQQIAAQKSQLSAGQKKIDQAWGVLQQKQNELNAGEAKLESGQTEIQDGWSEYEQSAEDAKTQIADAQMQITEGEDELQKARQEIADAKAEIAKIENPKWYVQDRSEAMADYDGYGENADRMRSIGRVFPVLFFLVAALISLTTMTRMVEEQRIQIGTMKALGYDKFRIAKKYMYYALVATLGGSVFGFLVGEKVLPFIIIYAYKIMYKHIPDILLPYDMGYALQALIIAVGCTLAATWFSCYRELRAQPAELMRPPAPKQGKRILLERVGFIWKRLNFTWKSSIRNLVRYKKRFFMTIFGIGGCMALMLVGFGLKDCIYEIVELQYEKIQFYDASAYMNDTLEKDEKDKIDAELQNNSAVETFVHVRMQKLEAKSATSTESLYMVVPENDTKIEDVLDFHSRTKKESYHLEKEQVIITEKIANTLKVGVGDHLILKDEDYGDKEVTIDAVCENYMGHYLYIAPELYDELYDAQPKFNSILYRVKADQKDQIEEVGKNLLAYDDVLNVSYTSSISGRLSDMLKSLNLVIVVLIISAGMLAFVVLYNLNNINITERKRELATLKVLGFYDKEVASYVYRENILLTLIGSVFGMGLGNLLHRYVIVTVEVEEAMFGRTIHWESYLYSFLFTVGFSLFVNLVMYYKLKKIDMVESLKSVE